MPLFPPQGVVDKDAAAAALRLGWDAVLGNLIKASTNSTYHGTDAAGLPLAVRVTPDPDGSIAVRQRDETLFVNYLAQERGLGRLVCAPIAAADGALVSASGGLSVTVWRWAGGAPVEWALFKWLSDAAFVRAWGRWFASMHAASRAFATAFPQVAERVQRYDDVHDGTLQGAAIHEADAAVIGDPAHWGVLHGDANISNFHWDADSGLEVFDFDQAQRGWWLADLAQAAIFSYMLAEAGAPIAGTPVPEADPTAFEAWLVEGYEEVAGAGAVDLERLRRMVGLRRTFYDAFASRALAEGVPGDIAPSMVPFLEYTLRWTRGGAAALPAAAAPPLSGPA